MRAVILDAYAENPGDLSWGWLEAQCETDIYDRTPADKILERAAGHEIVFTNKTPLRAETLEKLPDVKYIGLLSTGFNVVDIDYCKAKGIPVCNIPTYSTAAVAQCVFAHILEHTNAVAAHSASVHSGGWANSLDFSYQVAPLTELDGKTIGIVGFGKIGKAVADIALAFGMKVIAVTNHPAPYREVEFTDIDTMLSKADFVSFHCPLTPDTTGMADAAFLAKMKKTAMLINTSRGPVVNEKDLAYALKNGVIAAAGIDVMEKEPPEKDNPLFGLDNCTITPHIAWAGFETRKRLMKICEENFTAFLSGKPINVVY